MLKFLQAIMSDNTPAEATQDFFLIGGQSNVGTNSNLVTVPTPTGRVLYSLMPISLTGVQPYKVWGGTNSIDFIHRVNDQYGWINHLLRDIADTGQSLSFYKYGLGGSQLTAGSVPYMSYGRTNLKNNGLNAWNNFKANNANPRLIFLWCQGFTDGLNEANSNGYDVTLSDWFAEVRAHFSEPNMPIIFNSLSNNATASTFRAIIKAKQIIVSNESINNILVDADNLDYQADNSHFSNVGVVGLSDRYLVQYNTI